MTTGVKCDMPVVLFCHLYDAEDVIKYQSINQWEK